MSTNLSSEPIRHRSGWQTLLYKELLRFWKVSFQTISRRC